MPFLKRDERSAQSSPNWGNGLSLVRARVKLPYQRMAVVADFQINLAAHTIDHAHRPVSLQSVPGIERQVLAEIPARRRRRALRRKEDPGYADRRVRTPVRSCNLRSASARYRDSVDAKIKGNCPSRSLSISCCNEKLDGRNISNGYRILAVGDYRKCTVSKYIAERRLHSEQLTACACELPRRRGVW